VGIGWSHATNRERQSMTAHRFLGVGRLDGACPASVAPAINLVSPM
jgi:hypothetical protein